MADAHGAGFGALCLRGLLGPHDGRSFREADAHDAGPRAVFEGVWGQLILLMPAGSGRALRQLMVMMPQGNFGEVVRTKNESMMAADLHYARIF